MNTESLSFLNYFNELEDPRQSTKVLYPLDELLLLCLCGVIAGCDDFTDIVSYGEEKLDFLCTILPFNNGIPSHDALNDLFRALDPDAFKTAFTKWAQSLSETIPALVAIDGKTLRGSRDGVKGPLHMVSAWAVAQKLVLGQIKTAEKSNEITAIPKLLNLLMIKGAIVTIDAMGCQKAIAAKIIDRDANYVLALKGNQAALHDDVKTFFESEDGYALPVFETTDADHGRIEIRRYRLCENIDWLNDRNPGWTKLQTIGVVETLVTKKGKEAPTVWQQRFYICSIQADLKVFANAVRGHWGIENSLHWVLDVTFNEDRCRIRKDNAPHIFTIFKHTALNIINKSRGKRSVKNIRKRAGWNNKIMKKILCS